MLIDASRGESDIWRLSFATVALDGGGSRATRQIPRHGRQNKKKAGATGERAAAGRQGGPPCRGGPLCSRGALDSLPSVARLSGVCPDPWLCDPVSRRVCRCRERVPALEEGRQPLCQPNRQPDTPERPRNQIVRSARGWEGRGPRTLRQMQCQPGNR